MAAYVLPRTWNRELISESVAFVSVVQLPGMAFLLSYIISLT